MKVVEFDGYSRLHPTLVANEFHPRNFTVEIEILGLRDLEIKNALALLNISRPKIEFEIGGVKSLFDVAPSFAADGNFNFGEDFLRKISIETKLLLHPLTNPAININITHGFFNVFVGRGAMPLQSYMFAEDDLEDVDDTSSVSSLTTENSHYSERGDLTTLTDFTMDYQNDAFLDEPDEKDDDEDNEESPLIPGVPAMASAVRGNCAFRSRSVL
jgi:hypothetical protein